MYTLLHTVNRHIDYSNPIQKNSATIQSNNYLLLWITIITCCMFVTIPDPSVVRLCLTMIILCIEINYTYIKCQCIQKSVTIEMPAIFAIAHTPRSETLMAYFSSCASSSILLSCFPFIPMISPTELDGTSN